MGEMAKGYGDYLSVLKLHALNFGANVQCFPYFGSIPGAFFCF